MSKNDWFDLAYFVLGNLIGWFSRHWGVGVPRNNSGGQGTLGG